MTSIYQRALGSDFQRLHPKMQERFGFSSADGVAAIGTGVMETIWHGPAYTLPFLYVGAWRRILFPENGRDVPFTIENYAYQDQFGRETVTWIRKFATRRPRRFDAYMIYSEDRSKIVDYLGTHQHLAVDIEMETDARGGLRIRSAAQRIYEGGMAFGFPAALSGIADVYERFDEARQQYRIEVNVSNPRIGPLIWYLGWLSMEWKPMASGEVTADAKPIREERRE